MTNDDIIPTLIGLFRSQRDALDEIVKAAPIHRRISRAELVREAIDDFLRRKSRQEEAR